MKTFLLSLVCGALFLCSTEMHAQNVVYPDGFPEDGKMVLEEKYPDATDVLVKKAHTVREGWYYVVEFSLEGKDVEVTMNTDGEVTQEEFSRHISLSDVPDVCLKSARENDANLEIVSCTEVERDGVITYRFSGPVDESSENVAGNFQEKTYIEVDSNGKILNNMRVSTGSFH